MEVIIISVKERCGRAIVAEVVVRSLGKPGRNEGEKNVTDCDRAGGDSSDDIVHRISMTLSYGIFPCSGQKVMDVQN